MKLLILKFFVMMQNFSEQKILLVSSFGIRDVNQWRHNLQSIMNIVLYIARIALLYLPTIYKLRIITGVKRKKVCKIFMLNLIDFLLFMATIMHLSKKACDSSSRIYLQTILPKRINIIRE